MAHSGDIKVAAALSGGGSKGAFQVGALLGLRHIGVEIDAYAGVSTGAIQALGGAMNKLDELKDEWCSIERNSDVHRRKLLPFKSIYDAGALRKKITNFAKGKIEKPLRIGVVSLQSGEFRLVDENAPNIADWVYASCAIPTEYEPLERDRLVRDKTQWIDGGARNVTPVSVAAAFGARGVLMIRSHPVPTVPYDGREFWNILDIAKRAVDVLTSEVSLNDLSGAELGETFHEMREALETDMAKKGAPPVLVQQVSDALHAFARERGLVRVCAITPAHEYSATNNYHPIDIRNAISSGYDTVLARQAEIKEFEHWCRKVAP